MAKKYLTEDNIKNILSGIEAKIPKELEVNINTNVNRTEIDILDSPTIILKYGTFGEATATLTRDWTDFDMLEIDTEYSVPGGSAYYDTFMVSTKALNNSAILSTSSPSKFCTTIHCTNAAIVDVNTTAFNLKYYYKATIISYSDTATSLKFMGSVGSTGSVTGTTITILAIRGINYTQSCGDTPLGTIISYMGITPPDEYLACDGTTYSIQDYWELAEFIKTQFGSYNYFGGDGTTTFAVPDLRGEFLRGTGTNSHANQGSGSSVGTHQDATTVPTMYTTGTSPDGFGMWTTGTGTQMLVNNADGGSTTAHYAYISLDGKGAQVESTGLKNVRPTNTSVLYCIKYTNSLTMQPANVYSTDEKRIGTWIDGSPLYQKTIVGTMPIVTTNGTRVNKQIDISDLTISACISVDGVYYVPNQLEYIPINSAVNLTTNTRHTFCQVYRQNSSNSYVDTIFIASSDANSSGATAYITLKYTKL